jgi:hypothetical protein
MGVALRSQLFRGIEPILLGRTLWTPPGLPQLVGESGDLIVPEGNRMSGGGRFGMLVSLVGLLQRQPGLFVSRQVILFALLFRNAMGMRGGIV